LGRDPQTFADLKGYTVGGTIHNHCQQSDWLHEPARRRKHFFRVFASDIAKRQSVPVFHVKRRRSRCRPCRVGQIAAEYRLKVWQRCSLWTSSAIAATATVEVDDPTITQPPPV